MTARLYFEECLKELKENLDAMCVMTERMIDSAVAALIDRDKELARATAERDKKVDELELSIERMCMRLLLKEQPVAADFRTVSTALKVITDIERIGDQAADICELIISFPDEDYIKELVHLKKMGKLSKMMVRGSVDSFINSDGVLAEATARSDDQMDELFSEVKGELVALIKKDSAAADQAIMLMMIAKYFERIGDHAVNVCEWTKYAGTGEHVKYQ